MPRHAPRRGRQHGYANRLGESVTLQACWLQADAAPQAEESAENASLAADVIRSKTNKRVLLDGAAAFNVKPKVGLKFLEEHGVIYNDDSISREESLARFLKTTPRLDKRLLGDFISRPDQIELLRAFMQLMDFDGVSRSLCLRRTAEY